MVSRFFRNRSRSIKSSKGATAIEYALIASLLSVALIGGYKMIGSRYTSIYNSIANLMS
ncbi:MAG: Flp family type IVb pilin [Holosporaceae bacterium]|nr:Flp family type IVb pilin [Holosporaceae bacterium]